MKDVGKTWNEISWLAEDLDAWRFLCDMKVHPWCRILISDDDTVMSLLQASAKEGTETLQMLLHLPGNLHR